MAEDEVRIGKGYQGWTSAAFLWTPLAVAYFADVKWVVASGILVIGIMLHESLGRLHDLCIRVRRTNVLLSERPERGEFP